MDMYLFIVLPLLWGTSIVSAAQSSRLRPSRPTRIRLTAERGGPPQGAQFVPIPTITGFPTGPRPFKRPQPITGIPPPPPELPPATEEPLTLPITTMPPPSSSTTEVAVVIPVTSSSRFPPPPPPVSRPPPPPPPPTSVQVAITQPPFAEPEQTSRPVKATTTTVSTPPKDDGLVFNRLQFDDDGSYYFEYLTKEAAYRKEQGFFKSEQGYPDRVHVKTGLYSYVSPEGLPVRIDYIADENGYRAYDAYENSRGQPVRRKIANTRRQQRRLNVKSL